MMQLLSTPCSPRSFHKGRDCRAGSLQLVLGLLQKGSYESKKSGKLTKLTCWSVAAREWVSYEARVTDTQGDVVPDPTVCIATTETWTRVNTLLVPAGLVVRTVRVELALWPTVRRLANHARLAGAVTAVSIISGWVGVGSARVGVAGVFLNDWSNCCKKELSQKVS